MIEAFTSLLETNMLPRRCNNNDDTIKIWGVAPVMSSDCENCRPVRVACPYCWGKRFVNQVDAKDNPVFTTCPRCNGKGSEEVNEEHANA